jgi:hypothetical protein
VPGLTPLPAGAVPGLTPLPAQPAPLVSQAAADPLAGLPPVAVLGGLPPAGVAGAGAPLDSPFAAANDQSIYRPRAILDPARKGLPWEYDPSMDTFGDTMYAVLSWPQEAFRLMRRRGGIVNPMTFFIIGGIIGQVPNAAYATIIRFIIHASIGEGPIPVERLLGQGALELVGGIFSVFLSGIFGMFISAAIWHVALVLVGGASAGYEATYRALCFGLGSIAVLWAIPIVGPLIGIFYVFIVLIYAFTHTHEIDGGRAALAVFLPLLVFCCLLLPFAFLSLRGLLSCVGLL